jgi:hypothetical protein
MMVVLRHKRHRYFPEGSFQYPQEIKEKSALIQDQTAQGEGGHQLLEDWTRPLKSTGAIVLCLSRFDGIFTGPSVRVAL